MSVHGIADLGIWARREWRLCFPKASCHGLKYIDLDFCENYVYGKQRKVSFSKVKKPLKVERLELVHTDV